MTVDIAEPPQRFLDEGNPVEQLSLDHSRFDTVAVKNRDDVIVVRARERDGTTTEFEMDKAGKLFKGVTPQDNNKRRDIDDDILDALFHAGFAVTDAV